MPACLILLLARTSRCPMVVGEIRKADAMVAASNPRIVCKIIGARMPGSIAGWAQANISSRRSSGIWASFTASSSSCINCKCPLALSSVRRRRAASIILRRATAMSHASGLVGIPFARQSTRAAAKASAKASSAPATSWVRAARKATSLP
jgi:hypothetical protein